MSLGRIIQCSAVSLLFLACTEDDPCGPGQVYQNGSCAAETPGGDAGGEQDAATDGPPGEAFGATCAQHPECTAPTDYCAVQPGSPGYCTAKGCDANASICPEGWTCFNLGQFAPGEPWICTKPR
jgi:hypothetical protein